MIPTVVEGRRVTKVDTNAGAARSRGIGRCAKHDRRKHETLLSFVSHFPQLTETLMALFRNPKPVLYGIVVFAILAVTAFATKCRAEPVFEVEAGAALVRGEAEAIALNLIWPEAGPKDADLVMGLLLVGSNTYGEVEQPNQVAIQFQMVDGFGRFDVGLGVALLQNTDAFNGSHANFSLLLGYRFTNRLGIVIRHWSNAGTAMPNLGRDMLLATWRF